MNEQWRVIVRVSLDDDTDSIVRNTEIRPFLELAGLVNISTGTWEGKSVPATKAAEQLADLIKRLPLLHYITKKGNEKVLLDHLWMYIDKA